MSEIGKKGFDPEINYSCENMPPESEQRQFFHYAALEAAELATPRIVQGPHFGKHIETMQSIDEGLKAIGEEYTAEYLFAFSYQSPEVQRHIRQVSLEDRLALDSLATEKHRLMGVASRSISLAMRGQKIEGLTVPPYRSQEDGWRDYERLQGCENACFRMIFEDITGWAPSQAALSETMQELHGTSVLDGIEYNKLMKTDVFSEISDTQVSIFEVIGADFDFLNSLTEKIKNKKPDARIYNVVNLRSDRPSHRSIIHAAVLHSADGDNVTYHDPKGAIRGEAMVSSQVDFVDRWAAAYNKARVVVATTS